MSPDPRIKPTLLAQANDLTGVQHIATSVIRWEQLNHSPAGVAGLKSICRAFQPGQSLMGLFSGGRSADHARAAQAIARQLGMALVCVDLSAVVSQYMGETEKALNHVFDSAKAQDSVLLFDEADALFGQRTDVTDSHDKYANAEISQLLKRLEAFRGLAILATQQPAVDDTFVRRFRHVIHFQT